MAVYFKQNKLLQSPVFTIQLEGVEVQLKNITHYYDILHDNNILLFFSALKSCERFPGNTTAVGQMMAVELTAKTLMLRKSYP